VSADEARKQSTHRAFFQGIVSSFSQWVYLKAGCKFAGFPQGFELCEGSVVRSTETRIKCFGAAFWKFRV
jgi:hypothetical protein